MERISQARGTSNAIFRLTVDGKSRLLKRYLGQHAREHQDIEKARLLAWREAGFNVPEVIGEELAGEPGPHLVIEWLEGRSLGDFLRSRDIGNRKKLSAVRRLLEQFHRRHLHVEKTGDPTFLHHDPNSGNIFLVDDEFYYLDFEASIAPNGRTITVMTAVELAKLLRWTARDLGREHLAEVLRLAVDVYGADSPVLRTMVSLVHRRPMQFIHRWRDRRKKAGRPGEITKYDIADGLHGFLS